MDSTRSPYKRADMWTASEDAVLLAAATSAEAARALSGRTAIACRDRRSHLRKIGVAPRYHGPSDAWSPDELGLLRANISVSEMARRTGRTVSAVKNRRHRLRKQGRL